MPCRGFRRICFSLTLLSLLGMCESVVAQNSGYGQPTTPATQYFQSRGWSMPQQQMSRPQQTPPPTQGLPSGKPFQNVHRQPTLSPYLTLDLVNDEEAVLPNYYAFYKPQQQQQQAFETQEAKIRRLQQQLRVANSTQGLAGAPRGGMPTTGTSSQFMNMGGYFPGLR